MEFKNPYAVYFAENNVDAEFIAEMLRRESIPASVETDLSVVEQGDQEQKPKILVEQSQAQRAAELIAQFEQTRKDRDQSDDESVELEVECDQCGKSTTFPANLDGTTQECPHCFAYLDIGELDWEEEDWQVEE